MIRSVCDVICGGLLRCLLYQYDLYVSVCAPRSMRVGVCVCVTLLKRPGCVNPSVCIVIMRRDSVCDCVCTVRAYE